MELSHDSLAGVARHDLNMTIVSNLVGILGLSLVQTVTWGTGIRRNGVKETWEADRGSGGWPLGLRLEQLVDWETLQRVLWYVYGLRLGHVDDVTVHKQHTMMHDTMYTVTKLRERTTIRDVARIIFI